MNADQKKKPGVAFWATVVVVVVLVAYPLSFGPACWIASQQWAPDGTNEVIDWFYSPASFVLHYAPKNFEDALFWYASLWI
jgi:hypothetical protein